MKTFKKCNFYLNDLPGDSVYNDQARIVKDALHAAVRPQPFSNAQIIHISKNMATTLEITEHDLNSASFKNLVTGYNLDNSIKPYAMNYGGHQFGNWAGQLGDGRAINLFETQVNNKIWALQLKGAGATPFSRRGDGYAVLRSSIREHLSSEAMHHLGISTTRSLALSLSGGQVWRDMFYDGNAAYEPGAIVCRASDSFIRFGHFELLMARGETHNLQLLVNHVVKHHYPTIKTSGKDKVIDLFKQVCERTLELIINWQRVGFVHGVMNTDNMSITGKTIDYGPYGWLEPYDPDWSPNTTDREHRRYAYGKQPEIALWNLIKLANALYPLVEDAAPFERILNNYKTDFAIKHKAMLCNKLGIAPEINEATTLIEKLDTLLQSQEIDMTIFYRLLSNVVQDDDEDSAFAKAEYAFYNKELLSAKSKQEWLSWFNLYSKVLQKQGVTDELRKSNMDAVNPKYVLRNWMAQLAIDKATAGDYELIDRFYTMLLKPYDEQPEFQEWFNKLPDWARDKPGCSKLSCSS